MSVTLLGVGFAAEVSAQTFKNCAQIRSVHPLGLAINFTASDRSGAYISREIYLSNQRMDRDRDGIICEDDRQTFPDAPRSSASGNGTQQMPRRAIVIDQLSDPERWIYKDKWGNIRLRAGQQYQFLACHAAQQSVSMEVLLIRTGWTFHATTRGQLDRERCALNVSNCDACIFLYVYNFNATMLPGEITQVRWNAWDLPKARIEILPSAREEYQSAVAADSAGRFMESYFCLGRGVDAALEMNVSGVWQQVSMATGWLAPSTCSSQFPVRAWVDAAVPKGQMLRWRQWTDSWTSYTSAFLS
jgi:hypothetical protein